MNIQLKQRLVGAVVLVALAVIFIPMLLPGEGDLGGGIHGSNIPPEPDFRFPPVPKAPKAPPVAVAPAVPVGDDSAVKPAPEKKVATKPAAEPEPKAKAKAKPKPKPTVKPASAPVAKAVPRKNTSGQVGAWVVQVGSFSARNNAKALRDKLRKQGYASFVESIRGDAGRVYRVRVGPELTRSAADKLQARLKKEAGLKGLVQAYP